MRRKKGLLETGDWGLVTKVVALANNTVSAGEDEADGGDGDEGDV